MWSGVMSWCLELCHGVPQNSSPLHGHDCSLLGLQFHLEWHLAIDQARNRKTTTENQQLQERLLLKQMHAGNPRTCLGGLLQWKGPLHEHWDWSKCENHKLNFLSCWTISRQLHDRTDIHLAGNLVLADSALLQVLPQVSLWKSKTNFWT